MSTTFGEFVWHDLMTPDPEASRAFYSALFGWTYHVTHYTHIESQGKPIGGMLKLEAAHGAPPHWMGYVGVEDIDATLGRARGAGGRILVPKTEIANVGLFAVMADPSGACLAPFQSTASHPTDPTRRAGEFVWDELLTNDTERCAAFYGETFGWGRTPVDMGPMGVYWLYQHGGRDVAGMMKMPPGAAAPPFWLAYVAVEDVDASHGKATSLGAHTYVQPGDIPGIGRFAVLADPAGASFAIYRKAGASGA
jgi:predicted enzyme related to lactoylglutathione lyase